MSHISKFLFKRPFKDCETTPTLQSVSLRGKQCPRGFACVRPGCGKDHHYLIHSSETDGNGRGIQTNGHDTFRSTETNGAGRGTVVDIRGVPRSIAAKIGLDSPSRVCNNYTTPSSEPVTVGVVRTSRPRVCFKVVPVKISSRNGRKEIVTYAFLDGGSDAGFCLESLVRALDLKDMKPTSFTMATVHCEDERTGHEVQLNVKSLEGDAEFKLSRVLTTESLPIKPRHMATNEEIRKWPHFNDISLPETGDKRVTNLIGSDHPEIIDLRLDKREGQYGQPSAVRTPFGWTVVGPIVEIADERVFVNIINTEREVLNAQLERMYNEEFGDTNGTLEEGMSVEDRKAEEIMDQSATLVNGHYQIRLPFREDVPNLSDSLSTAARRLAWLERKMQRDSVFHRKYSCVVEK